MKQYILLDTDIGDDIDDAVALTLSLRASAIELAAVTTVYKDTPRKARLAKYLLTVWGYGHVPVAAGEGVPYVNAADATETPCQYPALPADFSGEIRDDAVGLILETVKAYPEARLVAIGPLTNIARAIQKEPETMRNARLTLMGGMFRHAYREGNIASDPEAADVVFNSGMPITMLPLDVTLKAKIPQALQDALFAVNHPGMRLLSDMTALWKRDCLAPILKSWGSYREGDEIGAALGMHDPMTIGYVARPDLFSTRPALVLIEKRGEYTRGVTVESVNAFTAQACGYNADIVEDVDVDAFMEWFTQTMTEGYLCTC